MDRRKFLALAMAGSAWLLMGHSPYGQWYRFRASRLIIVTDKANGSALPLGEAVARVLARYRPETRAMIGTTSSSLDTVKLLESRQLHVALLTADEAWEALQGIGKFEDWEVPLRTLAVLDSRFLHLVTLEGRGISGIPDLKGKRVATGTPGSRTEIKTGRVLEAYGIDPGKDIRQEPLTLPEAVTALKAGTIDALAQDDTIPNEVIRDLAATPGMTIRLLNHGEAALKMRERYGRIYHRGTIPQGTYPGVDTDVTVAATAHLLVCRKDFPRDRAYQLAKALAEHQAEWASPQQGVHQVALRNAPLGSSLPFHPGALDYYQEKNR
ncbi:MAG: TAXI family TRAP transporter solute-binding subunit [Candidatus Methylomirabilales bacterium]